MSYEAAPVGPGRWGELARPQLAGTQLLDSLVEPCMQCAMHMKITVSTV